VVEHELELYFPSEDGSGRRLVGDEFVRDGLRKFDGIRGGLDVPGKAVREHCETVGRYLSKLATVEFRQPRVRRYIERRMHANATPATAVRPSAILSIFCNRLRSRRRMVISIPALNMQIGPPTRNMLNQGLGTLSLEVPPP
jgi:hypothetical protein